MSIAESCSKVFIVNLSEKSVQQQQWCIWTISELQHSSDVVGNFRKRIICVYQVHGKLYIDDGAIQAVIDQKSSLFASGIVALEVSLS